MAGLEWHIMIKALREAAAKVPVPKKKEKKRQNGLSIPRHAVLACFYLNTITLLQDISRRTLPLCRVLSPAGSKKLGSTSDVIHQRPDRSPGRIFPPTGETHFSTPRFRICPYGCFCSPCFRFHDLHSAGFSFLSLVQQA